MWINYLIALLGLVMLAVAVVPVISLHFRMRRQEAEREREWQQARDDIQSGDPERVRRGQQVFLSLLDRGPL